MCRIGGDQIKNLYISLDFRSNLEVVAHKIKFMEQGHMATVSRASGVTLSLEESRAIPVIGYLVKCHRHSSSARLHPETEITL